MKLKIYILLTFSMFILTSCFDKEEKMYLPPTAGDLEVGVAELTSYYKNQVYYDLGTNTPVSSNIFSEWDLGFASSDTSWIIVLNTCKKMHAGNSFSTDFESITSASGIEMKFDRSDGNPDSTALAGWYKFSGDTVISNEFVYVIDRGYDENFSNLGYKKILFQQPVNNKYIIKYADLDGQNEKTLTIEKDSSVNYVCFSFDNGIVDIEPPKNEWTLRFTSYRTLYMDNEGNLQPYTVTGALLNPHKVEANLDTITDFSDITIEYAQNIILSKDLDVIGFDWKQYDFEGGFYTVNDSMNYIIKDQESYLYRFHFIDFYNDTGEKGYPTFEFSRL